MKNTQLPVLTKEYQRQVAGMIRQYADKLIQMGYGFTRRQLKEMNYIDVQEFFEKKSNHNSMKREYLDLGKTIPQDQYFYYLEDIYYLNVKDNGRNVKKKNTDLGIVSPMMKKPIIIIRFIVNMKTFLVRLVVIAAMLVKKMENFIVILAMAKTMERKFTAEIIVMILKNSLKPRFLRQL